ncbi:MAG: hypothetical protein NTV86_23875 [Planctomycetota bacterium]|nr:hypothetical protein [Planctomycetota bacterium]
MMRSCVWVVAAAVSVAAMAGVARADFGDPVYSISNPASVIEGKPVYGNTPWSDYYNPPNDGLDSFWMRGTDNYWWYPENQMAFTGFDSAIKTIRVWTSPFNNTNMTGYTFKSSTYDLTDNPGVCDPANYETDLGTFSLPLVTYDPEYPGGPYAAAVAAGWVDDGPQPPGTYKAYQTYYDFTVSAPVGTKSLLVHVDNAAGAEYCQYQGEIQAFGTGTGPSWPDYLAGDFNKDGEVGPEDFGILKDNFGLDGLPNGGGLPGSMHDSWTLGDANDDGEVGPEDFGLLKDNFGLDGGPTGTYPLSTAPEPATLVALFGVALPMLLKRRAKA